MLNDDTIVLPMCCTQSATMYRQDNAFLPKEYIFKVQEVRNKAWGSEKRKTTAKGRVDMSQYCSYR